MTPEEQRAKLDYIKNSIKKIDDFRSKIERQQLEYPLDSISRKNISENVVTLIPDVSLVPAGLGTYTELVEIKLNEERFIISTTVPFSL